jgi:hypothetical protein
VNPELKNPKGRFAIKIKFKFSVQEIRQEAQWRRYYSMYGDATRRDGLLNRSAPSQPRLANGTDGAGFHFESGRGEIQVTPLSFRVP